MPASATATGEAPRIKQRGLRQNRFDENIHRPLAWAGVIGVEDAAAILARPDAEIGEQILRRDGDEARLVRPTCDWRAAFSTAARAQPPPIQPSAIEPSAPISALAPALAAVTETVRTTVASAKGSPLAWR